MGFTECQKVISDLIAEASANPAVCQLMGPKFGHQFVLRFTGEPTDAARRARKVRDSLRLSTGLWKNPCVSSPTGDSIQLFVAEDRSPQQVQKDIA